MFTASERKGERKVYRETTGLRIRPVINGHTLSLQRQRDEYSDRDGERTMTHANHPKPATMNRYHLLLIRLRDNIRVMQKNIPDIYPFQFPG